jgi:hypothetical protein
VDPGLPDGPHFGPFWGSPDAPVWGLKPLVSVYWPLEAIPYHARARRYIGNPRSLGSIYGIGTPGIRVLDPKSPSSQPGSWRPGSQMGSFGPPLEGLRGVSLGYGPLNLSGVPQIGPQIGHLGHLGPQIWGWPCSTHVYRTIRTWLNVGRISGLDPYLDPFWSRCGPNGARGWTPNPPPSMPRHPNT